MPDSSAVLFSSVRHGSFDVFVQELEGGDARLLVGGPEKTLGGQPSPDGSSVLYGEFAQESCRFMELPLAGGAPRVVLEAGETARFRCALDAPVCLMSELGSGRLLLSVFDLELGVPRPLTSIDMDLARVKWDVSPDGTRVAVVNAFGQMWVLGLEDGAVMARLEVTPTETNDPVALAWAADGQTLYVARSRALVRADLSGNTWTLWEMPAGSGIMIAVAASPDGRYLAMDVLRSDSDVWLIENP
jgi:Tol biopolymer transport system component